MAIPSPAREGMTAAWSPSRNRPGSVLPEIICHVQIGVHACLEHRDLPELVHLRGVRVVVERSRDQDVEPRLGRFTRGLHEIGA